MEKDPPSSQARRMKHLMYSAGRSMNMYSRPGLRLGAVVLISPGVVQLCCHENNTLFDILYKYILFLCDKVFQQNS